MPSVNSGGDMFDAPIMCTKIQCIVRNIKNVFLYFVKFLYFVCESSTAASPILLFFCYIFSVPPETQYRSLSSLLPSPMFRIDFHEIFGVLLYIADGTLYLQDQTTATPAIAIDYGRYS